MITTVTGKNQVTVPSAIAGVAKIARGTRLDWQLGDREDTLVVQVLPDRASVATELRGAGCRYCRDGLTVHRLVRERAQDDEEAG